MAVIALVLASLGASGCVDPNLIGEDLYLQRCASCHGVGGEGARGPAIGPDSNAVLLTDDQLEGVVRIGPGAMPAFDFLSDEQIDSLVEHLRELQAGP